MSTTFLDSAPATLGLSSVMAGSLPPTLLTPDAPERYMVEAVFNRRADAAEIEEILGERSRTFLSGAGHPTVQLTVADRRLQIANTNLDELRDGLAATVADLLADISVRVRVRRQIDAARSEDAAQAELVRQNAVTALARSIVFGRSPRASEPASLHAP